MKFGDTTDRNRQSSSKSIFRQFIGVASKNQAGKFQIRQLMTNSQVTSLDGLSRANEGASDTEPDSLSPCSKSFTTSPNSFTSPNPQQDLAKATLAGFFFSKHSAQLTKNLLLCCICSSFPLCGLRASSPPTEHRVLRCTGRRAKKQDKLKEHKNFKPSRTLQRKDELNDR